jgi:hypothetical protein
MFVPTRFLDDRRDPFQPPDRRLRRCQHLVEHGREPLAADDDATREGWGFFCALRRCRTEEDRERLAHGHPAVAAAHDFALTAGPLRRAELEARLLGEEGDEVIAAKMGLAPATVAAFHDLHFNVRPYLGADSYIVNVVLGSKALGVIDADDPALLMKLFGYGLGGPGVDSYLEVLRDPPAVPASLADLDLAALQALRRKLQTQVLVLALSTPAAALHPATWLRLGRRCGGEHGGGLGDGPDVVLGSIRSALDVLAVLALTTPSRPRKEAVPA